MIFFNVLVLLIMIIGSVAAAKTKNLLAAIITFMVYSFMMSILWQKMNAPDLAITEVAVGSGVTTILFLITYRKIKVTKK